MEDSRNRKSLTENTTEPERDGFEQNVDMEQIPSIIEAILFVTGDPIERRQLCDALDLSAEQLEAALNTLRDSLDADRRGLRLNLFGEKAQLTIRPDYAPYVEKLLQPVQRQTLSQAVLETLSIIAYRQPITRLEVEEIRGVKCDYSIQVLISRGLVHDVGRKDTVGRPLLYATTDSFLQHFGISSLEQLPQLTFEEEPEAELPI